MTAISERRALAQRFRCYAEFCASSRNFPQLSGCLERPGDLLCQAVRSGFLQSVPEVSSLVMKYLAGEFDGLESAGPDLIYWRAADALRSHPSYHEMGPSLPFHVKASWLLAGILEHEDAAENSVRSADARPGRIIPKNKASHSVDFREVDWFGNSYTFTISQAKVVDWLWDAWEKGPSGVGKEKLLKESGRKTNRLDVVFRDHPAWKTMIVAGERRGTYRLAEPADGSDSSD